MITIRRGQSRDLAKVVAMLRKVWQDDYVGDSWLQWVEQPEHGVVLVAEQDELIVGTCYVKFRSSEDCWFQAMRVHPDYRRLGVGSRLTEAALREAQSAGMKTAYLGIDADNDASAAMTERAGFERITDYQIMRPSLLGIPSLAAAGHGWRQATRLDLGGIDGLIRNQHQQQGTPLALFGCWEWQVLDEQALKSWIDQQTLWVWEDSAVRVVAGLELFGKEGHLFAPAGGIQDMVTALGNFLAMAAEQEATDLHIWLPRASALVTHLRENPDSLSRAEDGYVIWQYRFA